jgi:hypothetical protein
MYKKKVQNRIYGAGSRLVLISSHCALFGVFIFIFGYLNAKMHQQNFQAMKI